MGRIYTPGPNRPGQVGLICGDTKNVIKNLQVCISKWRRNHQRHMKSSAHKWGSFKNLEQKYCSFEFTNSVLKLCLSKTCKPRQENRGEIVICKSSRNQEMRKINTEKAPMHAPSVNQLASVRNLFLQKLFYFLSLTHLIKQITLEKGFGDWEALIDLCTWGHCTAQCALWVVRWPCSQNGPVSDTIRRRGGYRGIF